MIFADLQEKVFIKKALDAYSSKNLLELRRKTGNYIQKCIIIFQMA